MFKRKIYDTLLSWKTESAGKTAALIEGARRVGKTTIVREFAQNEYESCIFIDFARAPQSVLRLFDDMGNVSNFDIFMLKANVYSRCIEDNLRWELVTHMKKRPRRI